MFTETQILYTNIAVTIYMVTLIYAYSVFGHSKYGEIWSKFAFWQALSLFTIILMGISILFLSGTSFSFTEIRPWAYLLSLIASGISTWYSVRLLLTEMEDGS